MKNLYFFILFLAVSSTLSAQQDAQYSMYRFNGLYINPAYAGSHEVLNATAIYRHQWVRMPGQPQTTSLAVHSPLAKDRVGLGLIYTFDKIGVTQTNSIDASFAYRLPVGKKKNVKLCFGLSAGVMHYSANLSGVQTTDASDPNFVGNNQNRWLPNVGFGFYAYSDRFFAGISVPRILANKLDGDYSLFSTSSNVARQYHHLLLTGGYVFNLGEKVKFIPSTLFKYVPVNSPVSFDFNATFVFVDRLWLGAAYRLSDSYNFMAAVNVVPQLKIGYCYDLAVSPLNKFTSGSHEVMLSFDALFKRGQVVSPRHVKYF